MQAESPTGGVAAAAGQVGPVLDDEPEPEERGHDGRSRPDQPREAATGDAAITAIPRCHSCTRRPSTNTRGPRRWRSSLNIGMAAGLVCDGLDPW